jgi:hypothetical protein
MKASGIVFDRFFELQAFSDMALGGKYDGSLEFLPGID